MKQAYVYEKLEDKAVKCNLCNHYCKIKPGKKGICNVRENRDGTLISLVYEKIIARHVDPIEKKPLFHFLPGSSSYSIATPGCNFKCGFCQNADIAQMPTDRKIIMGENISPYDLVQDALLTGSKTIAYTYTEPTVYFELAHDTAKLAHENGIKNIFVTNGYMSEQALSGIAPYLDGANVDLKAFTDEFYKKMCRAKLEPVKKTLRAMKAAGVFVEVTTLIIPGLNDDKDELKNLALFIANELGPETPWHVSRFHPAYMLTDRMPTPFDTLMAARDAGINAGLKYVYMGNVPGSGGEDTICPSCGKTIIKRTGFYITNRKADKNGDCEYCGAHINGVWK